MAVERWELMVEVEEGFGGRSSGSEIREEKRLVLEGLGTEDFVMAMKRRRKGRIR